MYRKRVVERTGGYRERCTTAEDADFWCRMSSFGATAHRVSNMPTLIYRNRADSMSRVHAEPDWTIWYPWARKRSLTPFGTVGKPNNELSWPVKTYDQPLVSIIIPCGPSHERLVVDACDSVMAQTDDRWECIVVDDTPECTVDLSGLPWVRVIKSPKPQCGPAVSRNVGLHAARGEMVAFLDADDYLMPNYLEQTIQAYQEHGGYVYTDWFQVGKDGQNEVKQAPDFDVMELLYKGLQWTITGLFSRSDLLEVGGFDTKTPHGWEDWDLYFHLATKQICGTHLASPLFVYRYWSGERREDGYAQKDKNAATMRRKWKEYTDNEGEKLMPCAGCGRGGGARATASQTPTMRQITNEQVSISKAAEGGMIAMLYTGPIGKRRVVGPKTGQIYRVGGDDGHRRFMAWVDDAEIMRTYPNMAIAHNGNQPVEAVPEPVVVRQGERA